jgi:transcription factor IIIB 90 kDa subunit
MGNVFELGQTLLQLVQIRLPLVAPSNYIFRFSAVLEYGDETHEVVLMLYDLFNDSIGTG